jgi:hypothetical protein
VLVGELVSDRDGIGCHDRGQSDVVRL